jgi:asparagine synthase (glutamine-hydrolysing)
MCGIAGFLGPPLDPDTLAHRAVAMADTLRHRGPDDQGVWTDPEVGLALAHRRLSILDLSAAGRQPMIDHGERYLIVFNGEIYNHDVLRQTLDPRRSMPWRGHSDTEVLLAAIATWGVVGALQRSVGMFAFALWDRQQRRLTLARDRLGEKPLYYGWQDGVLLFGSELKALRAHPAFRASIDRDALAMLLRHAYVPTPHSIYRGIHKLPPGTCLTLAAATRSDARPIPYWSARAVAERGQSEPFRGSAAEAAEELEHLLLDSTRLQMIADVPLGAFLSGGVDSSLAVALMQAQADRPVRTFTVGFREQAFDEAGHARAIAAHLGTDHTELAVTPAEARAVIPLLPRLYDEPFGDSSQIPTYLIAKLARRHVSVSLSGDGGDELFGGYNRYAWGPRLWQRIGWLPSGLRHLLGAALTRVAPASWDTLFRRLQPILPVALGYANPGDKLHKLAGILGARDADEIYGRLVSLWQDPHLVVPGSRAVPPVDAGHGAQLRELAHRMMCLDLLTYLPDDILVKVDRAAMGVGLETRIPLLDHRLVEFAWRLPLHFKIRGGQGKWLLRRVLCRYVPEGLVERPKMGFGIPLGGWLRGPLRDWSEDLLDASRLQREGWMEPGPIRALWDEHLGGGRNWAYLLWNVLVFQAWLEEQSA